MSAATRAVATRLRGRPDSEHEMSLNRLGFALVILLCQAVLPSPDTQAALMAVAMWSALSLGVFLHILVRPGICLPRRAVALLFDVGFLSWYLHIGGETHAAFVAIYLWIVFGNGFRFGLTWLRVAMAVALAGFIAMVATTPFWYQQPHLSAGMVVGHIVLPLYAGALIRKLSDATRAAEAASQAKSLFLANVSHELRTPLNAIIGMGALLRDSRLGPGQRDMVRTIGIAARSLLELIDDILDLSRIEAGRMPVRTEEFDLLELLVEIRSLVAAQAQARGIQLGLHLAAGTPAWIRTDRRHLREILLNLAGNAVKFTERGGVSIAVRGEPAGPATILLRFEVSDTGIGVAPEAQQRIFESFTQAAPDIITRFGGTGLGLAICRRLVTLLGGSIGIESMPGAGSTFWFTIVANRAEPPAASPASLPPALVLLASGDLAARLAPVLELLGPVVRHARSFADAVQMAEAEGLTVLTEAGLAPGAGENAAVLVPPAWPAVPVVLMEPVPPANLPRGAARWAAATVATDCAPADLALALRMAAAVRAVPGDTEPSDAEPGGMDEERDASVAPATPARRLHVLVADDNAVNRKVAARILEREGHAVTLVSDGEAALDALEAAAAGGGPEFDIVLMDVNMPVLDGIEATKLYRFTSLGRARPMPILALTADATPEMRARCTEAGMDGCITKPVEPAQLLEAMERVLPRPKPEPAREITDLARHPRFRPAAPPPLDPETIGRLEALGGAEFMTEVANDFLREAAEALHLVVTAAAAKDAASFRAQAHALGSIAANIGARPLQTACSAAQRLGHAEFVAKGRDEAEALAAELERVRDALKGLRGAA